MAVRVNIDFDKIYELDEVSPDFNVTGFNSPLENGKEVPLKVKISTQSHALLPNVYNLAFGPLNKQGKIDDRAELPHKDYSRVFSTILFSAYAYLLRNPGHILGVDGSDNTRAYFYYRALKRNFTYLTRHFDLFGVKYFVRITRFGKTQYDNPFDFQDIMPYPFKIGLEDDISQDTMYNYFLFSIKS